MVICFALLSIVVTTIILKFAFGIFAEEIDELLPRAFVTHYDAVSLLPAISRPDVCTVVVAGALWDAHFNRWLKLKPFHQHRTLIPESNIEFAFIRYGEAIAKQDNALTLLPDVGAWERSPGSFIVRIFRNGIPIRNRRLEQDLRQGDASLSAAVGIVRACSSISAEVLASYLDKQSK